MSSRFPIGVGQTTSRPPVTRRSPGPGSPPAAARRPRAPAAPRRSSPPRRRSVAASIATASRPGSSARSSITSRAGASSSSPAAITPPPITTTSGLKMFTRFASPTPSARPIVSIAPRATGSPALRELGDQRPGQLAPLLQRVPERGVRPARDGQRRLAHQRGAGRHGLQAAPVRAVALARRPVHVDHHVPHLGAAADPAAVDLAAQKQAAADPGAEREQHHLGRTRAPPDPRLAQHGQFASLSTTTGSPSRSAITSREGDVLAAAR